MSEVGAVYQVEITRAGGWLVGDHDVDAETLHVDAAWDFDVDGGTLVIDDVAYEYTSVTFATDEDTGEPVDDEPATIVLASGLETEQVDGDLVLTFPYSETKTALVEAKGFGEAVFVRVPHDLYDKLPEGIWGTADEAPTVTIVQDGDGWVVEDVLGREPVVDGGFIDPDTMPPAAPVEPVAPDSSPTPDVSALGIGSLRISWEPVTNDTSVMYDVYLADESPVVVSPSTLLESTAGSMVSTRYLPDGETALEAGTTYYAVVQSRSEDQYGPVSGEGSGTPVQVTGPDIAASAVNAEHISAQSIDGEKLTGTVFLGSNITTAEEGERYGLSANEGFYSYGPDGDQVFSAMGGNVSVTGDITATSLQVTEGATWGGANVGATSASTEMASGITAPGSPPTVEWGYDEIALDGGGVAGDQQSYRRGLVLFDSHYWVASYDEAKKLCLLKFDLSGDFAAKYSSVASVAPQSLTLLGGTFYVGVSFVINGATVPYLERFNTSGTYQDSIMPNSPPTPNEFTWGSDGTNLVYAFRAGGTLRWQRYSTAGGKVGSVVVTGSSVTPSALVVGAFDFGASRYVFGGPSAASVFNASGTAYTDYYFPCENTRGLAWRSGSPGAFLALRSPTRVRVHTGEMLGEGRLPELWAGATFSGDGGYETLVSPRGKRSFAQRARHTFRLPVPLPGLGGAGDPDTVNFYVGRTSGRAKLQLQASVDNLSPGDYASVSGVPDLSIPDGSDNASDPPPASNTFPSDAAVPYEHRSQAVIPGTDDPQTLLDGSGYARLYGLQVPFVSHYRATGLNIPNQSSTQFAIGTPLISHDAVTYVSGGTWVINWPGLWRVTAQIDWNAASSGYRTLTVLVNGSNAITTHSAGGAVTACIATKTLRLDAADEVTVEAYQNSGGQLGIYTGHDRTYITFERVGI